jgi:oligopeptide/dipeptide ABC transporter ATP-binding protein
MGAVRPVSILLRPVNQSTSGGGMTDTQQEPADPLLSVSDLRLTFRTGYGGWFGNRRNVRAVDGVSFDVQRGGVLGIVGESSCGKSSIAKSILNIHIPTFGHIVFDGKDLVTLNAKAWRDMRREIQYVFQDPLGALDPRMTVLAQVIEPLVIHSIGSSDEQTKQAHELLEAVGLLAESHDKYPHELSGGQRQRVVLARALILKPRLLICDEPVSALDVSIQAQVIQLLEELKTSFDLTIMFISHDLSLVRYFCDTIVVMYLGRIVESGSIEEVFANPRHPYTQALISSIPVPEPTHDSTAIILQGEPPSPFDPPTGCHFHPRCEVREELCRSVYPELDAVGQDGHLVACHVVHGRKLDP